MGKMWGVIMGNGNDIEERFETRKKHLTEREKYYRELSNKIQDVEGNALSLDEFVSGVQDAVRSLVKRKGKTYVEKFYKLRAGAILNWRDYNLEERGEMKSLMETVDQLYADYIQMHY